MTEEFKPFPPEPQAESVSAVDTDYSELQAAEAEYDGRHDNPGRPRRGEEKHVQVGPEWGALQAGSAEQYEGNPHALFNDTSAQVRRKRELPEHRIMIMLKAQGKSNREIAALTNYTPVAVNDILRQPWARDRLVELIHENGEEPIAALLRSSAVDSIVTLIDLRDDPNAPKAVRKSAADSLLDRFLGKPTQRVESYADTQAPTVGDIAELDRQIASAVAEEKRLIGGN